MTLFRLRRNFENRPIFLSIIVEYCKGKQTYLHSLSLNNKILRHRHSIAYKNIYSSALNGKGIAIVLEMNLNQKTLPKLTRE